MDKIINSLFLSKFPTGLGVYSREVLKRISPYVNKENYAVLVNKRSEELVYYINRPILIEEKVVLNPLKRAMKLNRIKASLYYSFTHHGILNPSGVQILTIHDLIPLYYPNQYRLQYYYYKYYLPKIISRSEKIIAISENTKKDIVNFYKVPEEKIKVIYNGYEHLKSDIQQNNNVSLPKIKKPYMLLVGTTFPHKNIITVLKAYKKIKSKIDLNCIIVGKKTAYFEKIRKYITEARLEDRVVLLDYVTDPMLKFLYKNAMFFVYPSLYEGFGLPLLEAMHNNIPVICSNSSSLPEVVGDAGILFDPYDINSLTEIILELFYSDSKREDLIKKGRENLKRFSWDVTAKEIISELELYK
jgi:glycosyltransferase involved in cell wall biosynthesis